MSNGVPSPQARAYQVWRALSQNEVAANVILPFALAKKASSSPDDNEQLWIALYDGKNNVEFMLSCTKGPLGNYPIFIVACKSSAQLAQEEKHGKDLADSLSLLVRCLLQNVRPQRVFSVFSTAKVTEKFAEIFEAQIHQEHGIQARNDPYYDATFTFCTRETFNESLGLTFPLRESEDIIVALRRADMSHLNGIKTMCQAFSETSWPYELDDARAELEARTMIEKQQVWVHIVQKAGQESEIACLVATTRESDNVTAVTKVFTVENWRGRGCAARLLHRVCQDVLQKERRVVLYVGNSEE
ncbi:hypothetical protein J3R82DRAFT_4800 [Butyriboletus roseoflavus]|nr:hypothetical protein J3R82DRAFT_4800 [Butyriboletus roseoflavus]